MSEILSSFPSVKSVKEAKVGPQFSEIEHYAPSSGVDYKIFETDEGFTLVAKHFVSFNQTNHSYYTSDDLDELTQFLLELRRNENVGRRPLRRGY